MRNGAEPPPCPGGALSLSLLGICPCRWRGGVAEAGIFDALAGSMAYVDASADQPTVEGRYLAPARERWANLFNIVVQSILLFVVASTKHGFIVILLAASIITAAMSTGLGWVVPRTVITPAGVRRPLSRRRFLGWSDIVDFTFRERLGNGYLRAHLRSGKSVILGGVPHDRLLGLWERVLPSDEVRSRLTQQTQVIRNRRETFGSGPSRSTEDPWRYPPNDVA